MITAKEAARMRRSIKKEGQKMEKTHTKVYQTKYRQPLWIQQFYGLPKDRKEAEERPVTIVRA